MKKTLETRLEKSPLTSHLFHHGVDIILEIFFRYGDRFFLQTKGVAMGNSFAPSLANLFMIDFEKKFILNPSNNPYHISILLFWYFIDDVFILFSAEQNLGDFFSNGWKHYTQLLNSPPIAIRT